MTVKKLSRKEVYDLIDGERMYQDREWPEGNGSGGSNPLTVGEFVLLMQSYLRQADEVWIREGKPNVKTSEFVRKVAGIAVNCMEQHGAPARKQ